MAGKCEAHCDHRSASCDHQAILETGYQESWLGICDVCQYGFLALAVPVPPMPIEEPGNAWQCADLASLQKVIIEAAELRKFPLDPLIPVTIEPTEAVFKKYMEHHFPISITRSIVLATCTSQFAENMHLLSHIGYRGHANKCASSSSYLESGL